MDITWPQEFQDMLAGWRTDPVGARAAFEDYAARLAGLAQVTRGKVGGLARVVRGDGVPDLVVLLHDHAPVDA